MKIFSNRYVLWTFIIVVILLITSPFIIWKAKKVTELNMLVIGDNQIRLEGLEIVFENAKKVNQDGQLFSVDDMTQNYDLFTENDYQFVYVSSTEDELTSDNFNKLKQYLVYKGGNIALEHSLFDLTTKDEVRYELETVSNVRWTGWKGISFSADKKDDLPQWIFDMYEKRYDKQLTLGDKGLIFVNLLNDDVVIVKDQWSEDTSAVQVVDGKQTLVNDYQDWFTVFDAVDDTEVESSFSLNINDEAQALLNNHNIPLQFPATVFHKTRTYHMLLLAGEFSRVKDKNVANNSVFQKLMNKNLSGTPESEPFWNVFKPTVEKLLEPIKIESQKAQLNYIKDEQYSFNTRSRAGEQYIEIHTNDGWEPFVIKGVNIGMGVPGYFPGEAAVSEAQYFRWFKQISDMNANVFRVYTLQSPAFYKALYEYNQIVETPLYFFHGAWVVEEFISEYENMFVDEISEPFHEEIRNIINAVYGNARIADKAGHASGEYSYDVSNYLLGWIVGIEFSGETVLSTNEKNKGMEQFSGTYFKTETADPFEIWLAQSLEYTANYEIEQYDKAHVVSYTNWPTTDVFEHPLEFNVREDIDKVDPNLVLSQDSFVPGQFYSFHIYPYYPDFIDAEYDDYIDKSGKNNAYAGYLNALKQHITMPSIITEFGMPASRGITHTNKLGRNQGGHSEKSQGEHLISLFTDILDEQFGGGLVFTWQDEWFKRTWNTMDYDNPDRRPYWSNYQTNEQYFGLLSFESGRYNQAIQIDGNVNDWEVLHSEPLYSSDSGLGLNKLYVQHDARYLYLKLNYNQLDMNNINTKIYFDTLTNQGNTKIDNTEYEYENGIDFVLDIKDSEQVEMFVDSYYDTFYYMNENILRSVGKYDGKPIKNSGKFNPIRLILSAMYKGTKPDDGETYIRPYEENVTGKFVQGNSNPESNEYNSIADYYVNEAEGVIEIRIPWLIFNFKDPSQKEVVKNIYASETKEIYGQLIEGINIFASSEVDSKTELLMPINTTTFNYRDIKRYEWVNWDHPLYHERLKSSYYDMQALFAEVKK